MSPFGNIAENYVFAASCKRTARLLVAEPKCATGSKLGAGTRKTPSVSAVGGALTIPPLQREVSPSERRRGTLPCRETERPLPSAPWGALPPSPKGKESKRGRNRRGEGIEEGAEWFVAGSYWFSASLTRRATREPSTSSPDRITAPMTWPVIFGSVAPTSAMA